ncbi:hypothetical protein [Pedobacter rhizosphaerae]|nr:hypothetical protein [Pedobacter rhizosphaerae]
MLNAIDTPFKNILVKDIGNGNKLYLIDFEVLSPEMIDSIDAQLVKICEGNSGRTVQLVKDRIKTYLTSKKGSDLEIGSIAEFMLHHHLNLLGFVPKFMYFNLEENSIKKGFDGYYLLGSEQWILESKSGRISTKNISHSNKIIESYNDLKSKLNGGPVNNPWQNAVSHAGHYYVGVIPDLVKQLQDLATRYQNKIFEKIKDYNIIPGSTIFLDGNWIKPDNGVIESEIKDLINKLEFKKIKVICLTKKSIDLFWDYLNS